MCQPDHPISQSLMTNGRQVLRVQGDGHCLLHAVKESLHAENIATVSVQTLCDKLMEEVCVHLSYYEKFSSEGSNVSEELQRYIADKDYNSDTIDLVLAALCNALEVDAVIYQTRHGSLQEIHMRPGRPAVTSAGSVHLVLMGTGIGAHYDAAIPMTSTATTLVTPPDSIAQRNALNPQPTTPKHSPNPDQIYHPSCKTPTKPKESTFSPFLVRPLPKAAPRQMESKGRKRRKTAILTDTPEKNMLAETAKKKKANPLPTSTSKSATRKIPKKTKQNGTKSKNSKSNFSDSSDDDEYYCLVCCEPYSNSRPNERWVQCVSCHDWSHEECTQKERVYVCQNCDSDSD